MYIAEISKGGTNVWTSDPNASSCGGENGTLATSVPDVGSHKNKSTEAHSCSSRWRHIEHRPTGESDRRSAPREGRFVDQAK